MGGFVMPSGLMLKIHLLLFSAGACDHKRIKSIKVATVSSTTSLTMQ